MRQLLFPAGGGRDGGGAGFRGAAALKLHFTWAMSQVFGQLEHRECLYMEDDYWASPNLYEHALWMRTMRDLHCPECAGSVLGEHPRDWTARHADSATWLSPEKRAHLHRPYVGCALNSPAGMLLPARTWQAIVIHADSYCDRSLVPYDDAIHALQNGGGHRKRVLEPGWMASSYGTRLRSQ